MRNGCKIPLGRMRKITVGLRLRLFSNEVSSSALSGDSRVCLLQKWVTGLSLEGRRGWGVEGMGARVPSAQTVIMGSTLSHVWSFQERSEKGANTFCRAESYRACVCVRSLRTEKQNECWSSRARMCLGSESIWATCGLFDG